MVVHQPCTANGFYRNNASFKLRKQLFVVRKCLVRQEFIVVALKVKAPLLDGALTDDVEKMLFMVVWPAGWQPPF